MNGCYYNDEIKVGEYVRTKKKGIFKVCSIKKTPYGYYCGTADNEHIRTFTIGKGGNAEIKNDILKHSSNIIDLIEVDDIVEVLDNEIGCKAKIHIYDNSFLQAVKEDIQDKNYELIGIASHELFESIKYEV